MFRQFSRPRNTLNLVAVRKAVIVEDFLYAAVLGRRDNKTFVQLVRVKLPDGEPELLGKADIAYQERSVGFMRYDEHILTDICFTKDKIYVATFAWGILAFDREGKGAGYSITTKLELPANKIQSCIAIDGKIYAGLEGGYLVEIDPQAQRFETLASSRRKEKLSPFDDGEAFRIPYFFADPHAIASCSFFTNGLTLSTIRRIPSLPCPQPTESGSTTIKPNDSPSTSICSRTH